ncbi:MAG TPA: site-2 protease family protein [Candidatus Sulfopaludibacter sp.]|jgi:Zn-dependent protease|nr:site-2 protease family protein [Candidatus Sulfopaludibacter sp.]
MHLNIQEAILNVALLWLLTTPHEFAHAWVATRLGDDTPRLQGRLTLNPLAHVDWLGTTILPFATTLLSGGFIGWGKPVYTQNSKLRGGLNGLALVALAGPASNVVMAVILAALAVVAAVPAPALASFLAHGVQLSLYLALFNMVPVPPLDGSKLLLAARVPPVIYNEIARAGFMILILLVSFTNFGRYMSLWSLQGAHLIFSALP